MVDAHIIAKTTLPDLPRVFARPRLMRQVDDAGALRVIQITGQAAQGKSTLAAEIVRRPGPAAVWMHLNPSDRDPANLFNLLVQALDNLDLAFMSDEIFHFFADLYGQPLAPPQLARLQDITDGWVGGLVLIREALRHVPQDQWPAYIDNGLPAALQGERLAYFSETVFAGFDEQTATRKALGDTDTTGSFAAS